MARTLWSRFFILLLGVSVIAVSSAFAVRELIVHDFRDFLEGQRETAVYWITADAERTYEQHGGWNREALEEDAMWALLLGFETRVIDKAGHVVFDSRTTLAPGSARTRRPKSAAPPPQPTGSLAYTPYPLFLAGDQIGMLEVHHDEPPEVAAFVRRSNVFLLVAVVAMGSAALLLSYIVSRRLTQPLQKLAEAAAAIGRGELGTEVKVYRRDEIGSLAVTFNRMAQALRSVEDLRRKLLTNLAHEFRTPLSAIVGQLEGMMDGLIPTTEDELRSLHEEAGRLRRMMEGCEDLARAQASAATLARQRVVLKPLLEQVLERKATAVLEKTVHLQLNCPEGLSLDADPDRLTQILMNLLDNAIKAVKDGGTVTLRAVSREREVVLAVEDDGVGIDAADLPLIFERFFRRSPGGLGIGLAITKELVEAHGGRIEVRSAPGQGSVFTSHFPV